MQRIFWIDLTKAIAAFLVVMIHVAAPILYGIGKLEPHQWHFANAYDSLSRLAVPLFFMVSGVLLLGRDYADLGTFFKKRLAKVVLPLFAWSLIYILFRKFTDESELSIFQSLVASIFHTQYYHLWFLYAIIGIYIFMPIFNAFYLNANANLRLYFVALWVLVVSVLPFVDKILGTSTPNHLPMITGYIGYMLIGKLLSDINVSKKVFVISMLIFMLSTIITAFGTAYLSLGDAKFNGTFYDYFSPNVLAQAMAFFMMMKYIGERIKQGVITNIINAISATSLGIYLLHPIVLYVLALADFDGLWLSSSIGLPLVTLCAFVVSAFTTYLLQHIAFIRAIVPK